VDDDWDDDNYAVRAIMVNSMSKTHLLKYSHEQNANRLWNLIKENMAAESEEMKIKSLSEMTNLKMNKEESVDEYMNRAEALKNQCEQLGKIIEDYELKMYVLRGLRVEFDNNVRILENQQGKTMKDIRYSLKQEEARRERKEEKMTKEKEGVRKVRDSSKKEIHCYNCGKKGHKSGECYGKVKCFNYQKTGHISSDCREVRRQESTRGRDQQGRHQGSYEMKRSEHGRKEETSMKTKDEAVMCTQDQKYGSETKGDWQIKNTM